VTTYWHIPENNPRNRAKYHPSPPLSLKHMLNPYFTQCTQQLMDVTNVWTTEYPTQSGLYWICNYRYRHPLGGTVLVPGATVVEVDTDDVSFIGEDYARLKADILSAEWCGPLLPPA
jgi:hypothetical protein